MDGLHAIPAACDVEVPAAASVSSWGWGLGYVLPARQAAPSAAGDAKALELDDEVEDARAAELDDVFEDAVDTPGSNSRDGRDIGENKGSKRQRHPGMQMMVPAGEEGDEGEAMEAVGWNESDEQQLIEALQAVEQQEDSTRVMAHCPKPFAA